MDHKCTNSDEVVKALREKKQFDVDPSVRALELAYRLGDEEARQLEAALEKNSSLTSLKLEINTAGAEFIARLLERNTSLTSLDIQYDGSELQQVANMFLLSLNYNVTLTSLNITGTDKQLTDTIQGDLIEAQLKKNRLLKSKDAQKNYTSTDLDRLAAWLDDAENQPQNLQEIESQMERLEKVENAAKRRKNRLLERLQKVVSKYQGTTNSNKDHTGKQSKKRKRSEEEEKSASDDSASSDSVIELSEEEPKSHSPQKGLKVATRFHKRLKTSDEIQWKSFALIRNEEKKLKEIPDDVIDYFKDPDSRRIQFKYRGVTYNKQVGEFPKYRRDLPFSDKKRQCIVCREKTAEYGNITCPRAVMCAGCAATSVWWPTPLFD